MRRVRIHFICMGAENLGVESLISVLKQNNIDVSLSYEPAFFADLNSVHFPELYRLFSRRDEIIQETLEVNPDFVGLSSMTDNYKWNIDIAREIKKRKPDIKIIVGGIHPTLVPDYVIKEEPVDYVICGEAEYSLPALLKNQDLSKIPGLYYKVNGKMATGEEPKIIENIDSLPLIDKELFYNTGFVSKDIYRTMASRGCPFNCSYCCYEYLHKVYKFNKVRQRHIDNVILELKLAKRNYLPLAVHFNDDIFTFNAKWTIDFLNQYRKDIAIPFSCIIHPKFISEEIARSLKDSGCYRVQIGIQSLNQKLKREVLKRYETNEEVRRCLDLLEKYKISFSADHIIGIDESEKETLKEEVDFYVRYKYLKMINVYWLSFYPKNSIIDKVLKDKEDIINRLYAGETVMYLAKHREMNSEKKDELVKREILLLLAGSLPNYLAKWLIEIILKYDRYPPYFIRYILYLISILRIQDYSWQSYIKLYASKSFGIGLKNLLKSIIKE